MQAFPPSPVTLTVDGRRFHTTTEWLIDIEAILLNDDMIDALMEGTRAEIDYLLSGSGTEVIEDKLIVSLRGSARALAAARSNCPYIAPETPKTAPDRFFSDWKADDAPETKAIIQQVFGTELDKMKRESNEPDLDISYVQTADLGNGWRFIQAGIGASNYHFGIGAHGTILLAKPPDQEWRNVRMTMPAYSPSFDKESFPYDGWPRLVTQPHRGIDPPYVFWLWSGEYYILQYVYPRGRLW